jgi:hypothetical protein
VHSLTGAHTYLDIADLYAHGAWKSAVSEYWSPVFSWLLAAALYVVHPAAALEAVLLHAILFAGYCVALVTFEYFLRLLIGVFDLLSPRCPERLALRRALLVGAYAAFVWGTVGLLGLSTPDVFVAALVYLVSGMLLQSAYQRVGLAFCAIFGALLGVCWLTKSAALLPGLATVPVFAMLVRRWRKPVVPVLCTLAALGAVCFPFLGAIRTVKGHWTFGKTGLLNYSWEVGAVTRYFHWQGGPEGYGEPVHPTRQVMASPPVYEFSTSLPVTYAPWFDPPHWYEGVRVKLDAGRQIRAFAINVCLELILLLTTPGVVAALFVWCLRRGKFGGVRAWREMTGGVWVWCGVTTLLYSAVCVEPRYLSGTFAVVSCLLMAPVLSVPVPSVVHRIRWFTATSVFPCLLAFWRPALFGAAFLLFELTGMEPNPNAHWREAQYMQSVGMRAGDPVAVIGIGANAYWARLVHAPVVAEIPVRVIKRLDLVDNSQPNLTDINAFWRAPQERQREVLDAFARAGVRWAVAEPVPTGVSASAGWTELPFTRKGAKEFGWVTRTFVRRLNP